MKRRDALKTIGGLAASATFARFLPGCGDDGKGGDDGPVGITTYVYLMLENHSYDNMLGARMSQGKGGDGFDPTKALPDTNGTMVLPYIAPQPDLECIPDPPHGWDPAHASFNNGAMDGFLKEHQADHPGDTGAMQYLTDEQVPITWALADAYTTCDRWFCSVMGPTLPNRAYWHAASSTGLKVNNEVLTEFSAGITVPTIYNRLEDKGIDWAYYYGNIGVVSLLGQDGPYKVDLGPTDGTGHIRRFGDPTTSAGQFFTDCKNGTLPPVVYIDPSFGENDDHPPVHPILAQQLISSIYNALAASPQWKNVLFVVTYDENGGFWDHVPPPKTVDDTEAKFGIPGFDQMGFRVPTLVMGPYVKTNYVSNVVYDHTSALKHLQNAFGLETLNPRMDAANDLTDCIDMERLAAGDWADPITLPTINVDDWPAYEGRCIAGSPFKEAPNPISEWADANPGKFGIYDIRHERG